MKQKLLQNLKFILIGVILVGGLTVAYADGWIAPTAAAPAGNISAPLHDGPTQVKDGSLSVGPFAVYGNAQFAQETFFDGMIRGGSPLNTSSDSQVAIGGTDSNGTTHTIRVTVAGNASTNANLINGAVANTSSGNLCAGADGTIKLCTITTAPTSQITLSAQGSNDATIAVTATLSQPILAALTATIAINITHAVTGCGVSTTPTTLGTVHIPTFTTTSSDSLSYTPTGDCPRADLIYTITSYTPTTSTTGEPIVAQ